MGLIAVHGRDILWVNEVVVKLSDYTEDELLQHYENVYPEDINGDTDLFQELMA